MSPSEHEFLAYAKQPPPLHIPSGSTVSIQIIDSTTSIKMPLALLMGPSIPGHSDLSCPSYSFLIEHPSGRKVLFDLGTRQDTHNLPPSIVGLINSPGCEVNVKKDVAQILEESGIGTGSIEAVVWSHWHCKYLCSFENEIDSQPILVDHIGNMKTFPENVNLLVGPGFKKSFLPGYPLNKDSPLLETDWEGRQLIEIEFTTSLKVGRFKAVDYFEDGSFYIIDAPGHAVGHICGLGRVSNNNDGPEDTFILMGGDACHHGQAPMVWKSILLLTSNCEIIGGQLKPNQYLPLPRSISLSRSIKGESICPGSLFKSLHRSNSATKEFYKMTVNFPHVYDEAEQTIHDMQEFDAAKNVLVIIAHDSALLEERSGFKFFPDGNLKDWKKDRLDEKIRWAFLEDFAHAVETGSQQDTTMASGLILKA
jgi:hypothetical protein